VISKTKRTSQLLIERDTRGSETGARC